MNLKRLLPLVFFLYLSASALSASELGQVEFPTSGSPAAREPFVRGVAALHSFWYEEAADAFREAQKADPGFAMAYWGEAMTYNHPVWSEQDRDAARAALERLGATPEARAAKAPTEREKAWLAAVEALYGEGEPKEGEKTARDRAYSEAMRSLHERWPDDLEAASFYALSLIGPALTGGATGDDRERDLMKAAAILEELVDRSPRHPGVLHYLIHAYDDPVHAPLGLRAARIYAQVAPAAHHALHMPSHIFVQLGRWPEAAASNEAAWAASVDWVKRAGLPVEKRDFHSLSWLQYVYLQQGRVKKAEEILEIARQAAREIKSPRVAASVGGMEARQLVETGRGKEALSMQLAAPPDAGHYHGDATRPILEKEAQALSLQTGGKTEEALAFLREAADLESAMPPPSGPPSPMKPAHELYGEILLEAGRAAEASRQFEASLLRTPNRAASLLGAARSAVRAGDPETARRHYAVLAEIWSQADADLPALAEVRGYLRGLKDTPAR
jgi:tetratricopeptide (TPR) repeat protein